MSFCRICGDDWQVELGFCPLCTRHEGLGARLASAWAWRTWDSEEGCFTSVARALARFYRDVVPVPADGGAAGRDWQWATEHRLFPGLRGMFRPPKRLQRDVTIVEVADLHQLYKVFERC